MPEVSTVFADSLSSLNDVHNRLGQSQYSADPEFAGTIFRIQDLQRGPVHEHDSGKFRRGARRARPELTAGGRHVHAIERTKRREGLVEHERNE